MFFGFYNVHKPSGPTSHDIVATVRRRLPRKTRIGHAGTLDPFAEGVLVLCVGPATRLAERVQQSPKRYRAEVTFGASSSTDDPEGEISLSPDAPRIDRRAVEEVLPRFIGRISQTPPAYSAVHVQGRRAYELARNGQRVTPAAREVRVHDIAIPAFDSDAQRCTLDVRCGSGTYIRSIARDLGEVLKAGAYCSALTRTAVGSFEIADAVTPRELDLKEHLLNPLRALNPLPHVVLNAAEAARVAHGNPVPFTGTIEAEQAALIDHAGNLLAVARVDSTTGLLRPEQVFPASPGP